MHEHTQENQKTLIYQNHIQMLSPGTLTSKEQKNKKKNVVLHLSMPMID